MNPSIWCTVIFYNLKEFFDAGLTETGFKRLIMDKIFFYWKMGAQKSVIERHPAFTTSSFDTSFVYLGDKLNFRPPFFLGLFLCRLDLSLSCLMILQSIHFLALFSLNDMDFTLSSAILVCIIHVSFPFLLMKASNAILIRWFTSFLVAKNYHLEKCFQKLDANLNISDCYNPKNQILLYILWFLAFRDNQTFCNCWSNA